MFKSMVITDQITQRVEEKLQEEGWKDAFLIDVAEKGKKLVVYLDADQGISFDRCRKMSRHLESFLDEVQYLGGKYVLEVSSPGIDRPIDRWRQFVKNVGRHLELRMKDGRNWNVELLQAEGDELLVKYPHPEKKKEWVEEKVNFEDVKEAIVQISFKKKKK